MRRLGFLIATLCLLASCSQEQSKENDNKTLAYDSPEFSEKFNSYIAVTNYYSTSDKGSSWIATLSKFYDQLGTPNKKDLKKEDVYFGNFMWGIDQSVKVAAANADKAPNLGNADKSLIAFSNEIISASAILQQLESYYKGKNYLDDKYSRADKLYSDFINKQVKLDSLYILLRKSMAGIKENRDNYFVELNKKEGKLIRYHMLLSMRYAKATFAQIGKETLGPDFNSNYDKLVISVDELNKLSTDDKALEKSNITLKSTFGNYLGYLTAIKGNFRMLMDINDEAKREEILNKLDSDFAEMIDDYNRI
ncbi:DUF3829 domain-containing protein [Pedobacter frigidisoli]|uniref:DUF3829 domain-containing protein n=1 Tax=Pedobacter frigidisoli TaxID=2530455 RepID=A0A4R0NYL9_9SPHI|nr:DUF3829 domain-containing protein [Pedobacter frigidisoli]TCD07158.1 DUF3829 domain-containing protein [Pedobacter frigidisoli]